MRHTRGLRAICATGLILGACNARERADTVSTEQAAEVVADAGEAAGSSVTAGTRLTHAGTRGRFPWLEPTAGTIRWSMSLSDAPVELALASGRAVRPSSTTNAHTISDGGTVLAKWSSPTREVGTPITASPSRMTVRAADTVVECVDPNGSVRWKRTLSAPISEKPV